MAAEGDVDAAVRQPRQDRLVHSHKVDEIALYNARPDKGYSLADCISMQIMRREGLTDVLTNDRHFEQEGFRALFRSGC